jgi:hypothetical protein
VFLFNTLVGLQSIVIPCEEMNKATSAGILEQSKGARNRLGVGLSYLPARLNRLAESIPGLLKSLKIPSQDSRLPPPPQGVFEQC